MGNPNQPKGGTGVSTPQDISDAVELVNKFQSAVWVSARIVYEKNPPLPDSDPYTDAKELSALLIALIATTLGQIREANDNPNTGGH